MSDLTTYERAMLRLQAFKMLEGWGTSDEKGEHFKKWTLPERQKKACEFVDWALADLTPVEIAG